MVASWRGALALAIMAGCHDPVQIIEAPSLDGLESAVFVRMSNNHSTQAVLTRTEGLLIQQPAQGGDRLVFAAYVQPVESFAWPEGDLPVLADSEDASFLPPPDRQWVLEPGHDDWRPLNTDTLSEVPLARPRVVDCLSSGGCYQGPDEAERAECTVCSPEPPAETLMPEAVRWDTWSSCPDGASRIADSDLALQVCELPELVRCNQHQWQTMLSSVCEDLVACGSGRFAPVLPEDASRLFVDRAAAAGGDGLSEMSALNSLSQAAAIASPTTVIYLADGNYDLPAFSGRLNLKGTCPQRVSLTGSSVVNATVSADRMTIVGSLDAQAGGHLELLETWVDGAVTVSDATANIKSSVLLDALELVGAARVRLSKANLQSSLRSSSGSVITATDVSLEGGVVHTLGAIDFRRSRIDGAGASVMAGGPVVFEDVWWQDSQDCAAASLLVRDTTASLTRVSLNRSGPLLFDTADADLDEVAIRDAEDCGPALTSSTSDMTVRRFAVARVPEESVVVSTDSHVNMQDILLSKGNRSAANKSTFDVRSPSVLTVERAEITDQQNRVFAVRGDMAELELYDVNIARLVPVPRRQSSVFGVREGTLSGARIRAVDAVEVVVGSRDSTYRISDFSTLDVVNPVRATDEADIEVTRAQFDETYGIVACAQYGAAARLNDVVVQGVRTEGGAGKADCPNGVVARGVTFSTSVNGGLVVTRFVVSDVEGAVFLSFKPGTIVAREGLVQHAAVAVVGDEETQLSEFVIRMRYEDVGQALLSR